MIYDPMSVILVPFPFTDTNSEKRRPALVLSSAKHQKDTDHVTLIMITTAKMSAWPDDYIIQSLSTTGLSVNSIIRQKIFTLDSRLVIRTIGKLAEKDKKNVTKIIKKHLCL